ncbi:MAG TPA: hypothetical protein PLQ56_23055 [Aggregatilineales bacterium]|jgi:hypothetical protein|nr:hypothetical protein [Anaerolineae bacterium]HUN09502.1 hypothetical protein [Aggregatilineales bacterium]
MLTIQIPEAIEQEARQIAKRTQRPIEVIITQLLELGITEAPVSSLSDSRVLELCDQMMPADQQAEMSRLLDRNQNGEITSAELFQLDELLNTYQKGTLRKAEAWKVAVARGLRSPVSEKPE